MRLTALSRRHFLKLGLTGAVAVAIGAEAKVLSRALGAGTVAAPPVYDLTITDAMVEMVNLDKVYHWIFADAAGPHLPGPELHAAEGDQIQVRVTNALDEPHAFAIHDTGVTTGPIPPGGSTTLSFAAPAPGTYIYLDPLNAPVNRLLGLHGMLIVHPADARTPYVSPPPRLAQLFADLGTTPDFPGEPWLLTRSRSWHVHSIDSRFNARAATGAQINPNGLLSNYLPDFFFINGQSGFFASHNHETELAGLVGQPHLIRIANTGILTHSLHIHGNHVFVCAVNGAPQSNVINLDSWHVGPLDRADWLLPFTRPPDVSGPEDVPLRDALRGELSYHDSYGLPQCPLEFPMHCHMEPSQTAVGGNYPGGLVTHWSITGDHDKSFVDVGFDCADIPITGVGNAGAGGVGGTSGPGGGANSGPGSTSAPGGGVSGHG